MLKLVSVLAGGYGLLLLFMYLMQGRMLYLPDVPGRKLIMTPEYAGLDFEDVRIGTADGVSLHGWFIPGESERVLLFFHGNAGNISHRVDSIRQFHQLGLSVLIIDYRGYGESGGRTTEAGIYRDAEAAWDYLIGTRDVQPDQIILFGRSLGASVAAWLAARREPLALIVESSFSSVPDIGQELYPWLPVRWLSRLRHATAESIREVRCPVLVIHSRDDEIIPFHHGQAIFDAAPEPRDFVALHGSHNDGFIRDQQTYLQGLSAFLDGLPGGDQAPER
ncbi:MAG: alpha/beta hydrolase [Gammaproteobacteria bacterium]